jgi:hypothetical protein
MMRGDQAAEPGRGPPARPTEDASMSIWVNISRAILAVVGVTALLLAGGNLASGGGSITDPVFPLGLLFGLVTFGAAIWTTAPQRWRAALVWLGIVAVVAAFLGFLTSFGDAALRDVLVYFGIPATIVLLATVLVATARVRAGPLGSAPTA